MVTKIEEIIELAKSRKPKKVAVVAAHDLEVLIAIDKANQLGMVEAILIGNYQKIMEICKESNICSEKYEIIDIEDSNKASKIAVELVLDGSANLLMKGLVDTSTLLKAVLDKEIGLMGEGLLSSVAIAQIPEYERLILLTDPAINVYPNLHVKKQIIENSLQVAKTLYIKEPKVAIICASEKVNLKMPDTVVAKELEDMNKRGEIIDCIVGGPLTLDVAISEKAARTKSVKHPVAGEADILVVPNVETGNVLYKSLAYFTNTKFAGAVIGAKVPIILTSRADTADTRLNTIALSVLF